MNEWLFLAALSSYAFHKVGIVPILALCNNIYSLYLELMPPKVPIRLSVQNNSVTSISTAQY